MHVHFICRGNVFRSRLAEAVTNGLQLPHVHATSSGTDALMNTVGDICWFARDILQSEDLLRHTASTWTQTYQEAIDAVDHVIFLSPDVLDVYRTIGLTLPHPFTVWQVTDIDPVAIQENAKILTEAKRVFGLIRHNVGQWIQD